MEAGSDRALFCPRCHAPSPKGGSCCWPPLLLFSPRDGHTLPLCHCLRLCLKCHIVALLTRQEVGGEAGGRGLLRLCQVKTKERVLFSLVLVVHLRVKRCYLVRVCLPPHVPSSPLTRREDFEGNLKQRMQGGLASFSSHEGHFSGWKNRGETEATSA